MLRIYKAYKPQGQARAKDAHLEQGTIKGTFLQR